jgi:hypothetical protein
VLYGLRLLSLQQLTTEADYIREVRALTRQEGAEQYVIDPDGNCWLLAGFSTTLKTSSWLGLMASALGWGYPRHALSRRGHRGCSFCLLATGRFN